MDFAELPQHLLPRVLSLRFSPSIVSYCPSVLTRPFRSPLALCSPVALRPPIEPLSSRGPIVLPLPFEQHRDEDGNEDEDEDEWSMTLMSPA